MANRVARAGRDPRRSLPRTAEALCAFVAKLVEKRRLLSKQAEVFAGHSALTAREATRAEIAFLDGVLAEVVKGAPWQSLDRACARRDNATLAGAVEWLAMLLGTAKHTPGKQGFPPAHLVNEIAVAFPDLDGPSARVDRRKGVAERAERLRKALCSPKVVRILLGRTIGEPHGAVAAAEEAIAEVAAVSRDTVRTARRELRKLRR